MKPSRILSFMQEIFLGAAKFIEMGKQSLVQQYTNRHLQLTQCIIFCLIQTQTKQSKADPHGTSMSSSMRRRMRPGRFHRIQLSLSTHDGCQILQHHRHNTESSCCLPRNSYSTSLQMSLSFQISVLSRQSRVPVFILSRDKHLSTWCTDMRLILILSCNSCGESA